ncbi:MAG TPA: HNH endonuclease [Clostridium sp.]|uniref:HNH endonuclease n=1 Tax=Clostridium sp. TaxID=1506 RepID=UPI002F954585
MNNYAFNEFTNIILKFTNEPDIEKALYVLARKGQVGRLSMSKIDNSKFADAILRCLGDSEFNKEIYDRNGVAKYLIKFFKNEVRFGGGGLEGFMKPIIEETKIMVEDCIKKYEDYMYSEFTEKQVKEVFINRVIWTKGEYSDYCFDNLNLKNSNAIHNTYAYNIFIDEYNNKFNTTMGKASERTQKKIEFANEKFDYKLEKIILNLQFKHNQKYIAEYLYIPISLYRSILKNMDLLRGHRKINQSNIETLILLDNENAIIKIHIDITQYEISEVEALNTEMCENISVKEGIRKQCMHNKIERNPKIVQLAKGYFKKNNGGILFCEVCGFNFYEKYGELGEGYIEAHHTEPLNEREGETETNIRDFDMLCSCCHRMLHRKYPCIKIETLKKIVMKQKIIKQQKVEG